MSEISTGLEDVQQASSYNPTWGKGWLEFDLGHYVSSLNAILDKTCLGIHPAVKIVSIELYQGTAPAQGAPSWKRPAIGGRFTMEVHGSSVRQGLVEVSVPMRCGLSCRVFWRSQRNDPCVRDRFARQLYWVIAEAAVLAAYEEDESKLVREADYLYTQLFCHSMPPGAGRPSGWGPIRGVGLSESLREELEERMDELEPDFRFVESLLECGYDSK